MEITLTKEQVGTLETLIMLYRIRLKESMREKGYTDEQIKKDTHYENVSELEFQIIKQTM